MCKDCGIVFSDLDGTLLNSGNRVSPETAACLRRLADSGIPFVPVSARMPDGISPVLRALGIAAPMVCYSGALILDEEGKPLLSFGMAPETALAVRRTASGWPEVCCTFYEGNRWMAEDPGDPRVLREREIAGTPVFPLREEELTEVHKLLCMGDAASVSGLEAALRREYPSLSVCRSKETYLEIMDGRASKSGALRFLCERFRVPVERSVAFGDNFNDADMLLAAGTGIAMGNAPREVREKADFVTLDNDREGIAAFFRRREP